MCNLSYNGPLGALFLLLIFLSKKRIISITVCDSVDNKDDYANEGDGQRLFRQEYILLLRPTNEHNWFYERSWSYNLHFPQGCKRMHRVKRYFLGDTTLYRDKIVCSSLREYISEVFCMIHMLSVIIISLFSFRKFFGWLVKLVQ